jgi:hypothetical protein
MKITPIVGRVWCVHVLAAKQKDRDCDSIDPVRWHGRTTRWSEWVLCRTSDVLILCDLCHAGEFGDEPVVFRLCWNGIIPVCGEFWRPLIQSEDMVGQLGDQSGFCAAQWCVDPVWFVPHRRVWWWACGVSFLLKRHHTGVYFDPIWSSPQTW